MTTNAADSSISGYYILTCVYIDFVVVQTDREARARRNGNYMIFDDDYIYWTVVMDGYNFSNL